MGARDALERIIPRKKLAPGGPANCSDNMSSNLEGEKEAKKATEQRFLQEQMRSQIKVTLELIFLKTFSFKEIS